MNAYCLGAHLPLYSTSPRNQDGGTSREGVREACRLHRHRELPRVGPYGSFYVISKEHPVSVGGGVCGSRFNVRDGYPNPFWRGNNRFRRGNNILRKNSHKVPPTSINRMFFSSYLRFMTHHFNCQPAHFSG